MFFYNDWAKRERMIGREEMREEMRQKIEAAFADDKDALEKVNHLLSKKVSEELTPA